MLQKSVVQYLSTCNAIFFSKGLSISYAMDIIFIVLQEYGNLWDTSCSLTEHLNWVEGVVLKSMEKVHVHNKYAINDCEI